MQKRLLGDYQIIKKIGQGPLGTVYLGEHRFIRKPFAIKVLPEELAANEAFIQRFEKEIGKIATLEHLNLVKVHNVSVAEGLFFIVSDYVGSGSTRESRNISQFLSEQKERLSEDEVASLLQQVAYALDYLHSKQVMHGSLKLNNIVLGQSDEGMPHLYLTDVGINRIVGEGIILSRMQEILIEALGLPATKKEGLYATDESDRTKLTKLHRSFMQGYSFLAPEQKSSLAVDLRADIYAFGILAYFLLMGYFPEGFFTPPSKVLPDSIYNWDLLVRLTLSQDPSERPLGLVALMEEVLQKELRPKELHELSQVMERFTPEPLQPTLAPKAPPKAPSRVQAPSQYTEELEAPVVKRPVPSRTASMLQDGAQQARPAATRSAVQPMRRPVEILEELSQTAGAMQAESRAALLEDEVVTPSRKPLIQPSELRKNEYEEDPGAIFQSPNIVAPYRPKEKEIRHVEPMLCEMAIIEGGEYARGSNVGARDEKPRHKIHLSTFAIDIHPVSNEQFVVFLEVMGSEKDGNNNDTILLKESRIKRVCGKLIIESGYAKHPVVGVSWYGAVAYSRWVGKRLPTEVEWEIAASSGLEENLYPFGPTIERSQANFFSSDTTPVMSYPANINGIFDAAGNVYEWCQDWYDYHYYETSIQEPDNPKGPVQGVYRVLRGGCWKSLQEDLRCAHRHRNNPGTMNRTYGFRCAADVG